MWVKPNYPRDFKKNQKFFQKESEIEGTKYKKDEDQKERNLLKIHS